MQRVKAGEPLKISAKAFNTLMDSAEIIKNQQRNTNKPSSFAVSDNNYILIRNQTGARRQRFDAVSLSTPIFTPTMDLNAFQTQIVFDVIAITGNLNEQLVILQETLDVGAIGRACLHGVTPVRIGNYQPGCHYVRGVNDYSTLMAGPTGSIKILWCQNTTNTQWALVDMDHSSTTPATYQVQSLHDDAGKYNCYEVFWADDYWAGVNPLRICRVTVETEGHLFSAGDLLVPIAPADANGVIPVRPAYYAFAK